MNGFPRRQCKNISMENNLADTAFVVPEENGYGLRWFMPDGEINLNGHATLAAGYCMFNLLKLEDSKITFHTKSGDLEVTKEDDDIVDRVFWPKMGVNEDPVCGNLHCNLTPFWRERLGKSKIVSHQLSPRGAVIRCED